MRVSCSSPLGPNSDKLIAKIKSLGLQAIVTPILVRAVYEGKDVELGNKIVALFERQTEHEIYVDPKSS